MRKKRLLIVGCGDIGLRVARLLRGRYRLYGLLRSPADAGQLRALDITPVIGDLDDRKSLARLAGLATLAVHTAPPPSEGNEDRRTAHLLNALSRARMVARGTPTAISRIRPDDSRRLVYISTSGVYGNCAGDLVPETRPVNPRSSRAARRVDAERQLRRWGRRLQVNVNLLRTPGIYAADRLPLARLRAATPAVHADEDSYSNHIHAEDLARVVVAALVHGRPGRAYHASDDLPLKIGDYFDLVADRCGLPKPPRVSRREAEGLLPASLLSFMAESRRLVNRRLHRELKVTLRYPTVAHGLAKLAQSPDQARRRMSAC